MLLLAPCGRCAAKIMLLAERPIRENSKRQEFCFSRVTFSQVIKSVAIMAVDHVNQLFIKINLRVDIVSSFRRSLFLTIEL